MINQRNLFGDVGEIVSKHITDDLISKCYDTLYTEDYDLREYNFACFRYAVENFVIKSINRTTPYADKCIIKIISHEVMRAMISEVHNTLEPVNGDYLLHDAYIIEHLSFKLRFEKMKRE